MGILRTRCIEPLFLRLSSFETIDIGCEFHDLLEQIGRFAFPIGHRFCGVCVAMGELYVLSQS